MAEKIMDACLVVMVVVMTFGMLVAIGVVVHRLATEAC